MVLGKNGFRVGFAALVAVLTSISCAESKFGAAPKKSSQDAVPLGKIMIPGPETREISDPFSIKNGDLEIEFDPGNNETESGERIKRPLTIYFALDVTGSMDAIIEAIKTNIQQFVSQLESKNFEPMIGIVTFTDNVDASFALSSDVSAFKNFVSQLKAGGGGDAQEASLAAVEEILRKIESEDSRPNSVKAILAISDNPGHRGGAKTGVSRDNCGITETVAAFNGIQKDKQSFYRLYHSMGPANWPRVYPCGGFASGQDQYNQVISSIFPEVPQADRGAGLSWPFTGDTLLNDFVGKLEEIKPDKDLVCLAKQAKLTIDDKIYSEWKAGDLAETHKLYAAGETLKLDKIIKKEDTQKIQSEGAKLKVNRCCVLKSDAEAGRFESCAKEYEQVVTFRVKTSN